MSNELEYRGYASTVEFSAEDRCFHGKIAGIRDLVAYDGTTVDELEKNFHRAVDEYLAFCVEEGKTPDKPFKGSLNIRIPSELHRALAIRAEKQHKSLNSVISEQLAAAMKVAGPLGLAGVAGVMAIGHATTSRHSKGTLVTAGDEKERRVSKSRRKTG